MIDVFGLFDTVKIKSSGVIGTIVDIPANPENGGLYIVESDTKGKDKNGYGGEWPLYDCEESDLELVEKEGGAHGW